MGAHGEGGSGTGVNPSNQQDNSEANSGAAYVYEKQMNGEWIFTTYLKASNTGAEDRFGRSVDVNDKWIVVGADEEDSSSQSDPNGNSLSNSGAVYLYSLNPSTTPSNIEFHSYLKAINPQLAAYFGHSVSLHEDWLLVGAYFENSNSTGIDGNPFNTVAPLDTGSAYLFKFDSSLNEWIFYHYLKSDDKDARNDGENFLVGQFHYGVIPHK